MADIFSRDQNAQPLPGDPPHGKVNIRIGGSGTNRSVVVTVDDQPLPLMLCQRLSVSIDAQTLVPIVRLEFAAVTIDVEVADAAIERVEVPGQPGYDFANQPVVAAPPADKTREEAIAQYDRLVAATGVIKPGGQATICGV